LLGDEELKVDCRQWINRQKSNISADMFSKWLQHGDDGDEETFEPILQREHVQKQANSACTCITYQFLYRGVWGCAALLVCYSDIYKAPFLFTAPKEPGQFRR
jgi:hypothetical protein